MEIKFKLNGKETIAKAIAHGFYNVDNPESYTVEMGHAVFYVPVTDAEIVNNG